MNDQNSDNLIDQLLALAVTDNLAASVVFEHIQSLRDVSGDLLPRRIVGRAIYGFYQKYRKAPGFEYFQAEVLAQYKLALARGYARDEDGTVLQAYVKTIGHPDSPFRDRIDPAYVLDHFGPYLEKERLLRVMEMSLKDLSSNPSPEEALDRVKKELEKTLMQSVGYSKVGVATDLDSLLAVEEKKETFTSGVKALDQIGVMPEKNTFFLLAAVPNAGKSWFLTNVVADNLLDTARAPKVAFLTLEMSPSKTFERVAMALLRCPRDSGSPVSFYDFSRFFVRGPMGDIHVYHEDAPEAVPIYELEHLVLRKPLTDDDGNPLRPLRMDGHVDAQWWWSEMEARGLDRESLNRRFALFHSGPDLITVRDFEEVLDRHSLKTGFQPDIIVVDYADLFRSHSDSREFRHKLYKIFEALRAMALTRNVAVVTVAQIRREGMIKSERRQTVDATDLAEDFMGKFAIPDNVVVVSSDRAQRFMEQATLSVEKTRETAHKGVRIVVQNGFSVGRFALNSWQVGRFSSYQSILQKLAQVKESSSQEELNISDEGDVIL
jgi:hypothetical protein